MEPPPVQYVTTPDGFNIAYAVSGRGYPFVLTPPSLHHIQILWRWPSHQAWLEGLAQRFRLIQFDSRGQGMSTRGLPPSFSIDDYGVDLEAVTERLQLERFILLGIERFGHVALHYALQHPDRVEALVLLTSSISIRAWPLSNILGVGRENWDLLLWSNISRRLPPAEAQTRLDEFKQMVTQADGLTSWQACASSDVSELLPCIRTPTLVLHPRNYVHLSSTEAVKLAAGIPDARLALIDSQAPGGLYGDPVAALAAIDEFLAGLLSPEDEPRAKSAALPTSLSVRQLQVLQLIAAGETNREIAEALVLSERTVERHVADVYAKLDVRNRAEAVGFVRDHLRGA